MQRKYKFNLEALLKLRESKESKVKTELGAIVEKIKNAENKIEKLGKDLDEGYKSQEQLLSDSTNGRSVKFYPLYFQGINEDIRRTKKLLEGFMGEYRDKLVELSKAMGDVKILENIKEKDKVKWKKSIEKREYQDIEDMFNLRYSSHFKKDAI